jgi:uncharacterized protein
MSQPEHSRRRLGDRALIAFGLVLMMITLIATRAPSASAASPVLNVHTGPGGLVVDSPTISVSGTGKVMGVPDTLTVAMQVASRAAHASDALHQNDQQTADLIKTLTSSGVDPKDVSTDSLNIQPSYDNNGRNITGYDVTEDLSITLKDLSKAGSILDSAATRVGDSVRINNMSLSISDDSSLLATARSQAVADAKTKAAAMAAGAGVQLGSIKSISDQNSTQPTPMPYAANDSLQAGAAAVPVSPGRQQVSVDVSVVYTINN